MSVFLVWLMCAPVIRAQTDTSLTLCVQAYLPVSELEARFRPLTQYLAAALGQEVELRVARSGLQQLNWVGRDVVDVAYVGPATYLELVNLYGAHPLLGRLQVNGSPLFTGTIFVRTDSHIGTLQELRGQRVAFGDVYSTMSYLVPRQMLARAGVTLDELGGYQLLGGQSNVALAVLSGNYAAGATKTDVFEQYKSRGLRSIATTPQISEYLFVARDSLAPALVERMRALLLAIRDDSKGLAALKELRSEATGIVPVTDADYDSLRLLLGADVYGDHREMRDE